MYTKSWSAFDRLVAIVPPGGSIGCVSLHHSSLITADAPFSLDDKLFSFWLLQADSFPLSHVKGIYRFETGIKVNEFRDLRANPRCLLESQVLSFRVRWSRMISTGVLGSSVNRSRGVNVQSGTPSPATFLSPSSSSSSTSLASLSSLTTLSLPSSSTSLPSNSSSTPNVSVPNARATTLGLSFDPYDYTPLPYRILVTGAAANFPSVANLVGDIFNAPVFMPNTQIDSAQVVPHRNAPAAGFASRGALGGAYYARWIWGKERHHHSGTAVGSGSGVGGGAGSGAGRGLGGFEEEIRRLHGKRWVASGSTLLRTNVGGTGGMGGAGGMGGSGGNSGTSTPYAGRSGLGSTVFAEEDEDEMEEMEKNSGGNAMGSGIGGATGSTGGGLLMAPASVFAGGFADRDLGRMRTLTGASSDISTSGPSLSSSTYATGDATMGAGGSSPSGGVGAGAGASGSGSTSTTTLTPVTALPTSDSEAQIGLAKVAEADVDAFMTYAAIVPEYCRLEGMLCKSLV